MAQNQPQSQPNDRAIARSSKVIVACKLPHGLRCRLQEFVMQKVPVLGGGFREEKMAQPVAQAPEIVINGWSHPQNRAPHCTIIDGFALTMEVPGDFMRQWMDQNRELDAVRNGLIFIEDDMASIRSHIGDNKRQRSGLERLDPTKLPGDIEVADEHKKETMRRIAENERMATA